MHGTDLEAQLAVDRDHVLVRPGIARQDAGDSGLAAQQQIEHLDLDEQAEPVPAMLRQHGRQLLESPLRDTRIGPNLSQRDELS